VYILAVYFLYLLSTSLSSGTKLCKKSSAHPGSELKIYQSTKSLHTHAEAKAFVGTYRDIHIEVLYEFDL